MKTRPLRVDDIWSNKWNWEGQTDDDLLQMEGTAAGRIKPAE